MSTFYNQPKGQHDEDWLEQIHSIHQRFKNVMMIITNFQIKYINDRASMHKTPFFEEVFEDNEILLTNVMQNLMDIEGELVFEKGRKKNISQEQYLRMLQRADRLKNPVEQITYDEMLRSSNINPPSSDDGEGVRRLLF